MFNQRTDDVDELGYINKQFILGKVTQEEIFSLVFDFEPQEYVYVTSPFRKDNDPGCWFEYYDDELRFKDFGNPSRYGRIKLKNIDCFDAVQIKYKLPNFYETLRFIKAKLIDEQNYQPKRAGKILLSNQPIIRNKKPVQIFAATRPWEKRDALFWKRYLISRENLIEDRVFPVCRVRLKNTKKGDVVFNTQDLSYLYTRFLGGRKKLYRPFQKKKYRFITNCTNSDVGGYDQLVSSGRLLIITKSYKDFRVLKNLGFNVVWFQNEGQTPNEKLLKELCDRFDKVLVFFDNDSTGIEASQEVAAKINKLYNHAKATFIYLPEELRKYKVSDPSDMIYRRGLQKLINFLTEKRLL